MELKFNIQYKTDWGQTVALCINGKSFPMRYTINDIWSCQFKSEEFGDSNLYGYQIESESGVVRKEWTYHKLDICLNGNPALVVVNDRWLDNPVDAPFYSSLFTQAVFRRDSKQGAKSSTTGNTLICVDYPQIEQDKVLAIVGSGNELGNWDRVIPMNDAKFPTWSLELMVIAPFEFKFVIADKESLKPLVWEEGENRIFYPMVGRREMAVEYSMVPRIAPLKWRGAGTAIPVFSLRTETDFGIGEFVDLKKMADWAAATGQSIIQILPINDTTMSHTWMDSYPYNANSTFALHPQYINLPMAGVDVDSEYLKLRDELNGLPQIDYVRVNNEKIRLLRGAFEKCYASLTKRKNYKDFISHNREWLMPYAMFCVLRDKFGTSEFGKWEDYAEYSRAKLDHFYSQNKREVDFHCFIQYNLHQQLSETVEYAHKQGVVLKGDLPIGISRTSVDAWVNPDLFNMDCQAGAPPDAFSEYGQNWGFPTYNWERMAEDNFAWWCSRLKKMAEYFDAFRIDHILGFFRIWEIPTTAVRGLLGYFNPAMPYSAEELYKRGFDMRSGYYSKPYCADWAINDRFGAMADHVRSIYMSNGTLAPEFSTQKGILAGVKLYREESEELISSLIDLTEDLLFIEDPHKKGYYHPRISPFKTYSYKALSPELRKEFDKIHEEFFYHRHNDFWHESAMMKLPSLLASTNMLACGEDLGMIPACVPSVMDELQILSLEIQRMPKEFGVEFGKPSHYPYLSVCTTSTHDMNPLRAWWTEDEQLSQNFYNKILWQEGQAPKECSAEICRQIVEQHVASPAIFTILPLQDWLSVNSNIRAVDPHSERINVPAIARYYWRYRMHLSIEQLLKEESFNNELNSIILKSRI